MQSLTELIGNLAFRLTRLNYFLATAESCTGGLIAATCTDMAGSSSWFKGGVVAYANEVKENILGVPRPLLEEHGAVSSPVVRRMALGALEACGAQTAIAVSGVAGPDGGTKDKPVGTVWIAIAFQENEKVCPFNLEEIQDEFPGCSRKVLAGKSALVLSVLHHFEGDRMAIRRQAVEKGLQHLGCILDKSKAR